MTPEAILRRKMRRSLLACIVLLCVLCASTFSFAWFARIDNVDADVDLQLQADTVSSVPFTAYIFDWEQNVAVSQTGGEVDLEAYDTVFVEKNEKNSLIYRAPVFGTGIDDGESFTVTLTLQDLSSTTGYSDYNLMILPEGEEDPVIANYLSNVTFIRCAVIASLQDTSELDDTEIYNSALEYFQDENNGVAAHTFFEGQNGAKTNSVSFTISNYANLMPEGAEYLNLYIEIGYDLGLIEAWTASSGTSVTAEMVGSTENEVEVESDFGAFSFAISG